MGRKSFPSCKKSPLQEALLYAYSVLAPVLRNVRQAVKAALQFLIRGDIIGHRTFMERGIPENERFVFWSVYDLGGSTDKSYDYDRLITKFLLYP